MVREKPYYSVTKHDNVQIDDDDIIEDEDSMISNSDVEPTSNIESEDINPIDVCDQVNEISKGNLNDNEVEGLMKDLTLDK